VNIAPEMREICNINSLVINQISSTFAACYSYAGCSSKSQHPDNKKHNGIDNHFKKQARPAKPSEQGEELIAENPVKSRHVSKN
jgi:hypothetical protein